VRKDPNSAEALSHLAWSYIHAGMHEEAADAYEQIIDMEPYNVDSYNNLGVVYGKYLGMPEKAVSLFKKALRIKPDADIHANLGNAYLDLGMYREALDEYKRAIQARPYYDRAHFGLGISFLRLNDQSAALKEYEILKKLNQALADELSVYLSAPAVPVQTK
jgi:tetratricopeptide (TPR) repeat protein